IDIGLRPQRRIAFPNAADFRVECMGQVMRAGLKDHSIVALPVELRVLKPPAAAYMRKIDRNIGILGEIHRPHHVLRFYEIRLREAVIAKRVAALELEVAADALYDLDILRMHD